MRQQFKAPRPTAVANAYGDVTASTVVRCKCSIPNVCPKTQVSEFSKSQNKGEWFWACPAKGMDKQTKPGFDEHCNFFKWERDEMNTAYDNKAAGGSAQPQKANWNNIGQKNGTKRKREEDEPNESEAMVKLNYTLKDLRTLLEDIKIEMKDYHTEIVERLLSLEQFSASTEEGASHTSMGTD